MKKVQRHTSILAAAALLFFYATAWLGTPPGNIWNSPDETANAYWSERVAEREPLLIHESLVGFGNGIVHPRSMDVSGDALVPGSFPGIFLLYGSLQFFSKLPLSAMTPILTALAGLVLFSVFRRIFEEKIAFWSALLFFLHPALIYYSGRGLFHNVLFADLLIFALGLFFLHPLGRLYGREHISDDILAGVLFGLALITRASEAPWVILGALALLPFMKKKGLWKRILFVIAGAALPLFIYLNINSSLYGAPFQTGYVAPTSPAAELTASLTLNTALDAAHRALPFGFHPRLVLLHGFDYGLKIFWWFSLAGLLGAASFLAGWKDHDRKQKTYFFSALGIGIWLLLFYGSWFVRDHYDPTRVTMGTSYVRYFLPIYILTLPWVAGGLLWFADKLPKPKRWFMPVMVGLMLILSFRVSVTHGDESLLAVRSTLRENLAKREALKKVIPPGAVIFTEKFDKVLFPDRMLIVPVHDDTAFSAVPVLAQYANVMWYGLDPSEEEYALLEEKASKHGFEIVRKKSPIEGETLYEFRVP